MQIANIYVTRLALTSWEAQGRENVSAGIWLTPRLETFGSSVPRLALDVYNFGSILTTIYCYQTKANMDADTARVQYTGAVVYADSTSGNNDLYFKGASAFAADASYTLSNGMMASITAISAMLSLPSGMPVAGAPGAGVSAGGSTGQYLKYDGWRTPAQVRSDLDLETGTDLQAHSALLDAVAALSPNAGKFLQFTDPSTPVVLDIVGTVHLTSGKSDGALMEVGSSSGSGVTLSWQKYANGSMNLQGRAFVNGSWAAGVAVIATPLTGLPVTFVGIPNLEGSIVFYTGSSGAGNAIWGLKYLTATPAEICALQTGQQIPSGAPSFTMGATAAGSYECRFEIFGKWI